MTDPDKKKPRIQDTVYYKLPCINEHESILRHVLSKYQNNIKTYSTDEGYCLNRCLRQGSLTKSAKLLYERLMSAFRESKSMTVEKPVYLYRGLQCGTSILGDSFIDLGFVSTSAELSVAEKFAHPNDNIMKIMLKPGVDYKLLPLERITQMKNEYELLLPPQGYFHFCGKTDYYQYVYLPEKPTGDLNDIQFIEPGNPSENVLKELLKTKGDTKEAFSNILKKVKNIVDKKGLQLSEDECENICLAYLFS